MAMSDSGKKPLGRILLEQKVLSKKNLQDYLEKQKETGDRLGTIIDRETPEKHNSLLRALSIQHGVPAVNLDEVIIHLQILRFVPREIAVRNRIIPIVEKGDHLFLAMTDPQNHNVVDEIEFVTGKKVFRYVALEHSVEQVIDECYRLQQEGEEFFRGRDVDDEKFAKIVTVLSRSHDGGAAAVPELPVQELEPPAVSPEIEDLVPAEPDLFQASAMDMPAPPTETPADEDVDFLVSTEHVVPARSGEEGKQAARILVVDDEEDILNLISKVLTENNYEVMTTQHGREALAIVKKENVDLIILDAMLPEIHGFDICKKLKASSKYGHIPVLMISAIYRGWRFAQDLKESYGVDAFIEKPFKIQELLGNVETMLQMTSSAPTEEARTVMSEEARSHLEASAVAYREGDLKTAIGHLKASIKIDPLSQKLHYNLALLYGKAGMVYYAISELETVLELEPAMFQAMKNLAVLYQEAGFKNKAIEMWERSIGICDDEATKQKIREHLMTLL
ncbi:MAG: response regulator [Pseudomonadota bacterium]